MFYAIRLHFPGKPFAGADPTPCELALLHPALSQSAQPSLLPGDVGQASLLTASSWVWPSHCPTSCKPILTQASELCVSSQHHGSNTLLPVHPQKAPWPRHVLQCRGILRTHHSRGPGYVDTQPWRLFNHAPQLNVRIELWMGRGARSKNIWKFLPKAETLSETQSNSGSAKSLYFFV